MRRLHNAKPVSGGVYCDYCGWGDFTHDASENKWRFADRHNEESNGTVFG